MKSILCVFLSTFTVIYSSRYVREQISVYQQLTGGNEKVSLDDFRTLISIHDDWICTGLCEQHMRNVLGQDGIPWDELVDYIVDTLYSGQISDDPYEPQEIHLSLTGINTEMKVMWVTESDLKDPFVEFVAATEDWSTSRRNAAVSYTYVVPQYWWPVFEGVIYESDMDSLSPGMQYKYRVGGFDPANETDRVGAEYTFRAAPSSADPDQRVVIAALADQGTFMLFGFATTNLLASVQDELGVDLVMYAGDLCYAGLSSDFPGYNITNGDEFEHVWDLWGIQNEPVAATRPFMVGVGNHEKFYNYTSFNARYKMPAEASRGNQNFWYSYDYGNIHWISISSEHSLDPDSEQMRFLRSDLEMASANRQAIPWIVMSLHRPIYCSSWNSFDDTRPGSKYQSALEPLLLEFDVDLTVTGHMHLYERVHPNVNGSVTVKPTTFADESGQLVDLYEATPGTGPVHVVQGNTGALQDSLWVHPKPAWSAKRFGNGFIPSDDHPGPVDGLEGLILSSNYTDTFGIGIITFANSTHLHYSCQPITGSIGTDSFWIVRRL